MIRPRAAAVQASNLAAMAHDKEFVPERDMYTILHDYEPETCVILSLWAFFIIGYKSRGIMRARRLLDTDLLSLPPGVRILPEDSREYARQVEALPAPLQSELLPRALLSGLHRFGATRNIQDVAFAIRETCNLETDRLDSELSMVRFVAWAIPAIGFVGTVRGIGNSLQQAHKAVEGDVSGVVAGLGTSFNSTLVALVAEHHRHAVPAPDAAAPGAHRARHGELPGHAPDPAPADALGQALVGCWHSSSTTRG